MKQLTYDQWIEWGEKQYRVPMRRVHNIDCSNLNDKQIRELINKYKKQQRHKMFENTGDIISQPPYTTATRGDTIQEIEKPVTVKDLIKEYDKLEDTADIREHCYRIMTVIENTTAESIDAEKRHIEAYEKQQKWFVEKEERKRLLTPKYDGSQLKTIYSHFIYSFAGCEWVCQKCGEKFHKSGEYNTLKKRIMEHNCKDVKLKIVKGTSEDPNDYMDSI
jgi:hypothetical protein